MKLLLQAKTILVTLVLVLAQNIMNAQNTIPGQIAAITTLTPKKGFEDEVLKAGRYIQNEATKENGCLLFSLNTKKEAPGTIVFFEIFKNQDALDHHKQQQHTLHFAEMIKGKVDKNEVTFLNNINTITPKN